MAQSNALREQPSMDEILASIRRIIDAGEDQSKSSGAKAEPAADAVVQVTVPPPAANDAGGERSRVPQAALPQAPATKRVADETTKPEIAAAVSAYLEKEKPAVATPVTAPQADKPAGSLEPAAEAELETDISEIEAALRAEFEPVDRDVPAEGPAAKYASRFTEADDGVFRQVGSLLRGKVDEIETRPVAPVQRAGTLVSDAVSQSVSSSFSSLSDLLTEKHDRELGSMAEEMLRPMLQEWLDNNLPSLVERLVRAEIERIARGEPRSA